MKRYKVLISLFFILISLFIGNNVYANNEKEGQKLLYQDVTINEDGSMKVREALWLNGDYNGTNRDIKFKNYWAYPFTGIYSNFSGESDIYDATDITDLKVFDISQSNFNSFESMYNLENEFKQVENAKKGKYGVYTLEKRTREYDVSIYCPDKKKKVIYMEYTINNAVVVHNDIAELYWCFAETKEFLENYKLVVHLPMEDENMMIWSHGSLSGNCSIVDNKTVSLIDSNVESNKYETLRIMFDKNLVRRCEKFSNVDGKEFILKYEKAMADPNLVKEENEKIDIENRLSREIVDLQKNPYITTYNRANELMEKFTWNDLLKMQYQNILNEYKEAVRQDWIKSMDSEYSFMLKYDSISQYRIDSLKREIDKGFDEEIKREYYEKVNDLQEILNQREMKIKKNILYFVLICYYILGVVCILKMLKYIFERKAYYHKYYRDFPNDDKAYIIDYLINKKVTTKTFFVTILDLISQNKILIEKSSNDEEDYIFILSQRDFSGTTVEKEVIEILFNIVGNNNKCSLKNLKNYGKSQYNSNILYKKYISFTKKVKKEIEYKNYFKKESKIKNLCKNLSMVILCISLILGFFIYGNEYISVLNYYLLTISFGLVYYIILAKDKNRTRKGRMEYSKWLAHKRFLKDFGKFDSKELQEIVLWDRYFVTAVTLGCSNKVLEKMEMCIIDWESVEDVRRLLLQYQMHKSIDNLERTLRSLIKEAKSHSTVSTSSTGGSSSYSSGDGFGGGSSSGGSGGGGGGWSRF